MNTNIAIINTYIGNSYDQKILTILNELLLNNKDINGDVYTTSINFTLSNKSFGILPIHEAKYFSGKAIVWDLISLDLVCEFPNITNIIYVHDNTLPWRTNTTATYKVWEKLFVNKKLSMLISDKNIYDIFKLTWNTGIFYDSIDQKVIYETIQQND